MRITSDRRGFLGLAAGLPALAGPPFDARSASLQPLPTRAELGLAPGLIHLNTASAGPTPDRVLKRALAAWRQIETNPVAMSYGHDAESAVASADRVRSKAAALIGASRDEILLTNGTTNGITTLAHCIRLREGDHVLLTDQEHEGGETGWLHRERLDGIVIDRVHIPVGDHDTAAILSRFEAALGTRTRAICVSHVLSPTGLRMPIAEIAALARRRGALTIVDGAQAVGQIATDVKALGCDAYATSGHKWLMGPKGTGFVYIGKHCGDAIAPPEWLMDKYYGSNSQGLSPMPLAIGLGEAIDSIAAIGMSRVEQHNSVLARRVYDAFERMRQLTLVSPLPGSLSTALVAAALPHAIDGFQLRQRMHDRHGIVIKMAEKRWFNGIRLSPHIFNTEAEVETALAALGSELGNWQA